METKAAGIYIHIPFCKQACSYCDFHFSTSLATAQGVTEAIVREIALQPHFGEALPIQSIYFGGGTPSILPQKALAGIVQALENRFDLSALREFTLEANPDDITELNLQAWKQLGINRFSIGVQSFREADLQYMNRSHTAAEASDCIMRAQDAGFSNLSIDLIYGTPGLGSEYWLRNLERAAELQVPHLSTYALTVEENTPLWFHIRKGKQAGPEEQAYDAQFALLQHFLAANNYEHYEISNSARKGYRALHNSAYWYGLPYYGFGPSAHGFDGRSVRYSNLAHNVKYARFDTLDQIRTDETLQPAEQMNEYILTRLRLLEGLDYTGFGNRFGEKYSTELQNRATALPAEWFIQDNKNNIRLAAAFRLLADGISARLFF